jgi:histone H2B
MKGKAGKNTKPVKELSSSSDSDLEEKELDEEPEGITKPKSYNSTSAFTTYISRVRKQVHPGLGVTKSSMKILESFIDDFFNRICVESSMLMSSSGNKTLRAQDVLAAINMILPGELKTHAVTEIEKALNAYNHVSSG